MAQRERSAIITGGGYGIGRAAALMLAQDGWSIVIVDRDPDRAEGACQTIVEKGGMAAAVVGDVTKADTFAEAVRKAHAFAPVQGLVTCAAMRHAGAITAITEQQWRETLDVILNGVFLACQAVIPEMKAAGGGSIVNVSSPDAFARRNMVAYASAKAAVNVLSQCLALDHVSDGIRVNTVLPGFTLTGMNEHYEKSRLDEAASRMVAGRVAEPEETAAIIRFLMSPQAETMTGGFYGQTLPNR